MQIWRTCGRGRQAQSADRVDTLGTHRDQQAVRTQDSGPVLTTVLPGHSLNCPGRLVSSVFPEVARPDLESDGGCAILLPQPTLTLHTWALHTRWGTHITARKVGNVEYLLRTPLRYLLLLWHMLALLLYLKHTNQTVGSLGAAYHSILRSILCDSESQRPPV